jgi:uncharacterized iron-regulated protein
MMTHDLFAHWKRDAAQRCLTAVAAALTLLYLNGCAVTPKTLAIKDSPTRLMEDTILRTDPPAVVSRKQLFDELAQARIVYVGETHTNPAHHAVQLEIVDAVAQTTPDLAIGMEMFDHTYQAILDQWSAGEMDEQTFIERTHWYANWRYDFGLYRDILEYAKEKGLRIIALNLPFHIPAKIGTGGIASLGDQDRRHLPAAIDTGNAEHRAYVEEIFKMHTLPGRENFDYFYEAQCAWEDAMAAAVADNLGSGKMVVLVGNGHITRKFGIPNRAHARNPAPFKTIYLAPVGGAAELTWADYLWATPAGQTAAHGR